MFREDAVIIFDGDSISAGIGAAPGEELEHQVIRGIEWPARVHNVAVSGKPVYECLARYGETIAPLRNYNAPFSVILFHAGDNDLRHGKTADETYMAFSQYVATAHTQGWTIIVTTELQVFGSEEKMQFELRRYNELLLANGAGADMVINLDLEPRLADPLQRANPELFTSDGLHPSTGGYSLIARPLIATLTQAWEYRKTRSKVVLFGEVQIMWIYLHFLAVFQEAQSERFGIEFVDSNDDRGVQLASEQLQDSGALILQINPEREITYQGVCQLMKEFKARDVLNVPMVLCKSLWPFDRPEHYGESLGSSFATWTRGDSVLRELVTSGESPESAAAEYSATDITRRVNLEALFSADMRGWRSLDALCDVKIADFIEARFTSEKLFNSYCNPSNRVMRVLIEGIHDFLHFTDVEIAASQRILEGDELLRPDTPIHPSVVEYFDLKWTESNSLYNIVGYSVDYSRWALEYGRLQARPDLRSNDASSIGINKAVFGSLLDAKEARDRAERSGIDPFVRTCIDMFPVSKAQLFQDVYVLQKLGHKRGGYFVEFGATDGLTISNTYLLEKEYGWSGILSEPFPFWHRSLARNRACKIDHRCVWKESGKFAEFWVDEQYPELATLSEFRSSDIHQKVRESSSDSIEVKTVSLTQLLDENEVPGDFDFLSVDTEGSEFDILSTFAFDRYRPKIITVEHNYNATQREKIYNLLTRLGYKREFEELSRWDDWYALQEPD